MLKIFVQYLIKKGTPHTPESKLNISKGVRETGALRDYSKNSQYIVREPNGNMIVIKKGITKYCISKGINKNNLRETAQGTREHTKGYTAVFYNEYK